MIRAATLCVLICLLAGAAMPAVADPVADAGQQAFVQCKACHAIDPAKKSFGPNLFGIYGRKAGSLAGFSYSSAMAAAGFAWTPANLDAFIADPRTKVPGNAMPFAGIKDADKRKALIAYLKTLH